MEKNIINTNSIQNLPFLLVFSFLTSGTYDTPNWFGNTGKQALCVVLRMSSPNFLHNALHIISVFDLRYASLYANFYSFHNNFYSVEVWTLGWPW